MDYISVKVLLLNLLCYFKNNCQRRLFFFLKKGEPPPI